VNRCNSSDLDLGSGSGYCTINGCELSDFSFSFFNMFLDNISISIPCISTYDIFSLYHESYPMGTNIISCPVSPSIPISSPPQQKAPSTQKQHLSPTLPSSSSHTPYSTEWIRGCIHEDPSLALCALKQWTHKKQYHEVNNNLICELSYLTPDQVLEVIKELKEPRLFVRGTCGRKLSLKVGLTTLGALEQHQADALVDSGCEGLVSTSNMYKNIISPLDIYPVQYLYLTPMVNPIRMVQLKKWSHLLSPLMTIPNGSTLVSPT